ETAGIERFDKQLKQFRVRNEQLEKQTAQAIGFHKTNELIESCIRIRSFCQPIKQNGLQFAKYLTRPRRDVETRRTSFKICERLGCAFCIIENLQIDFGGFHWRFGDDPLKNRTDPSHPLLQRRCEIFRGRKAKAACETEQSFRIFRNSVRLLFGLDLQAMLYTTEKSIRVIKSQDFLTRQKIQLTQCS